MAGAARYDGIADWYDERFAASETSRANCNAAIGLLGDGPGRLLDVGCGGGRNALAFAERGWTVNGVDVSEDQLRLATKRGVDARRADARSLPFPDSSFDAVVSVGTHTDMDDFGSALVEIARVLRPGGPFVYVGLHPCFVGPHAWVHDTIVPELHPGYFETGWRTEGPGIWTEGLRAKVGENHLPLGAFVQSFVDAGLVLERFEEPPMGREYPYMVALRWRR
jgi:SAM-dependent methyltransferase